MTILAQTFFTFVGGHFVPFSFFTAWHSFVILTLLDFLFGEAYLTFTAKLFAGLKAGMLWAGMVMVVPLDMLRATFLARFLIMKLPKPLRNTGSFLMSEPFTLSIKASTTCCTRTFSTPVCLAISFTISALVIVFNFLRLKYLFSFSKSIPNGTGLQIYVIIELIYNCVAFFFHFSRGSTRFAPQN